MRKWFVVFLMCRVLASLCGDNPEKIEQFIYSIEAFNGKGFSATFCAAHSDTIYLLAGVDNFMQPRKSLVYYWTLSDEWKLDSQHLYVPFEGSMEITGKDGKVLNYQPVTYTYSRKGGKYEVSWEVFLGKEAEEEGAFFQQLIDEFSRAQDLYKQEQAIYQQYRQALDRELRKVREAGGDVTKYLRQVEKLEPPIQPDVPDYYVYPLRKAVAVNLAAGEYSLRFKNSDGLIMEGSEKQLIVFEERRRAGIGYEIVPGDKWTKPYKSYTPSSVLYINGSTDLYVKPFFQAEYNDLYYNKMLINDSRGSRKLYRWEELRQVPEARLEITSDRGDAVLVEEKNFITVQTPGASLGYVIEEFEPEGAHENREPNLKAFYVPVSQDDRYIQIRIQQKDHSYNPFSYRQIRIVTGGRMGLLLLCLALSPLLVMLLVLLLRQHRLR